MVHYALRVINASAQEDSRHEEELHSFWLGNRGRGTGDVARRLTGNVGYNSDYIYRGVFQSSSSAFAGADYTGDNGLYIGTWWADVTNGTETDLYLGWQGGGDNVKFKIGYTGYSTSTTSTATIKRSTSGSTSESFRSTSLSASTTPTTLGAGHAGLHFHVGHAGARERPLLQNRHLVG